MSPRRSPQRIPPAPPYQEPAIGLGPEMSAQPSLTSGNNYAAQQNYHYDTGSQQPLGNYFSSSIPVSMSIMPPAAMTAPYSGVSVIPFGPMPHVFESLMREPSSMETQFNDSLAALNRLTSEVSLCRCNHESNA